MANMAAWIRAERHILGDPFSVESDTYSRSKIYLPEVSTVNIYTEIKNLGLETVVWKLYSAEKLLSSSSEIESFIEENKPCLFIHDPITCDAKKEYMFDVTQYDTVDKWIRKHSKSRLLRKHLRDINKFNYLITTQISNSGDGFVGSVFSDGNGRMLCETLHVPGICNHRDLSQPSNVYDQKYFSSLFIDISNFNVGESGDIWATDRDWLSRDNVVELMRLFMDRKGYFEIVKGIQNGHAGIYTTGHETCSIFSFPHMSHTIGCSNSEYRTRGTLLKEGSL